ncbi:MAG: hypothetical protein KDD47_23340, partial [Acidobacteria bacterium]|nr:hypothetical protein [Acidobacteriota bacterium]
IHQLCTYCLGQINRQAMGWTSLTNLGGPSSLGSGHRDTSAGPAQAWRWAEFYWGIRGIDDIRWEPDSTGTPHNYVVGRSGLDAAEYRMMLGQSGANNDLGIIGKAVWPGPVVLNVYSDGHYDQTYLLDAGNGANQTQWRTIHNWGAVGPRHVAIELVLNEDPAREGSTDFMYLDGLGVW